ncbi:MAG TPA: glycosyltransferase family 2 protein [Tepidimicrobium sp.]|nr:glycosyltransferase family 2 protein [Tepidimicrobium sp.]
MRKIRSAKSITHDGDNELAKYKENEENLGGALAGNEGIKIWKGESIIFLDDDDEYKMRK